MPVVDADGAAALARDGTLVDARIAPRYRGEMEPVDRVAGHIPGAVNLPAAQLVDGGGRLLASENLRATFEAAGVRPGPVGAYCGSGVTAAQTVLALHLAGYDNPNLYVGSWSNWCHGQQRPIALGENA
jgi:thiosulfate/3-mercaptopyruvate sulfurtransferase